MYSQSRRFTFASIALMVCLLVIALGALPAGWLFITRPDGSGLGMPLSFLAGSPFPDFTIPGVVLFSLFGIGSLVVLYGLIVRPRWAWTEPLTQPLHMHWSLAAAGLIGIGLLIWIVVQVIVIKTISFLQPTIFLIGLAIVLLAWRVATQTQPSRISREATQS